MYTKELFLAVLIASVFAVCGAILAGEPSRPGEAVLVVEKETLDGEKGNAQKPGDKFTPSSSVDKAERPDRGTAPTAQKSPRDRIDNETTDVTVEFEYSECMLRDPAGAGSYSERELYSILLALTDSGAKAAKPFVESKDEIDKGARQAAARMIDMQEEESARIREIMLKEKMDFDSGVSEFADRVTARISPRRYEGAAGRNILPFAARHHAIVVTLALDALEFSRSEESRELAHDLIVEHTDALLEVKELQQRK